MNTYKPANLLFLLLVASACAGGDGPDRNLLFAGGYSGHGVTVGVLAGQLLSDLVAGEPLDPAFDGIIDRKLPRVPTGRLLTPGFALAKRIIGWDDSRG